MSIVILTPPKTKKAAKKPAPKKMPAKSKKK